MAFSGDLIITPAAIVPCIKKREANWLSSYFCLDPADSLAECLNRCKSVVFFSATLTPFNYYHELFGCHSEAKYLNLPSPFPIQNLTISRSRIQTRYRSRTQTMGQLASAITDFLNQQKGNALIFFPATVICRMLWRLSSKMRLRINYLFSTLG